MIYLNVDGKNYTKIVRVGVAGDFYSQDYFDAWLAFARKHKNILVYSYTKSIPFWIKRKKQIPCNFKLTASFGGKFDHLIFKHKLKFAKVVMSEKEAKDLKLKIDHDDSLAYSGNKSFCLLLHGTQAKGSAASKALQLLRKQGIGGYNRLHKG